MLPRLHQALRRRPQASAMLLSRTMKAVAAAPVAGAACLEPKIADTMLPKTLISFLRLLFFASDRSCGFEVGM